MPEEPVVTPPSIPIPDPKPAESENLQMLTRQLYARQEPTELIERTKKLGEVPARQGKAFASADEEVQPAVFADILNERTRRHRRLIQWIGIGAAVFIVFGAAVGATLWYRSSHQLTQQHMSVQLNGPGEFTSGQEINYTFTYENKSRVEWKNVSLVILPPSGFQYISAEPVAKAEGPTYAMSLPDVAAGAKGQAVLHGRLIGQLNSAALTKATITVSPANAPKSQFTADANLTTTIRSVPVDVAIEASSSASQGERLLAIVHVRNVSQENINNLYLSLNAPPGVQLAVDDKEFSSDFSVADGQWELPPIKPLEEVKRTLVYYIDGQAGEQRSLTVQVGLLQDKNKVVQRELTQVISVTASALSVQQLFNDQLGDQVVTAGDSIKTLVQYRNTGTTGLRNVVVKVVFDGEGLDTATLKLPKGGAYDPITKTITWTSSTVPDLALLPANKSGEVEYDFSILPTEKFAAGSDKGTDNSLVATASVDSADIATPLGQEKKIVSDRSTLAIASQFSLDATAFYDDGRLGLPSTGPIPPKVGETTAYTIRFRLGSTLNDMTDVELNAVLPDGVKYTDKTYQTTGEVDFNERTGQITWKVPILSGLTGRTIPAPELNVQVSITPGENQRDQEIPFLNSVTVTGKDTFVSKTISSALKDFPSTRTANPEKYKVE